MDKNWKLSAVIGLLAICFLLIWMNRYQYEHVGVSLVRVNRFTGKGCYFVEGKWDSRSAGEPLAKTGTDDPFGKYGGKPVDESASTIFGSINGRPNLCE